MAEDALPRHDVLFEGSHGVAFAGVVPAGDVTMQRREFVAWLIGLLAIVPVALAGAGSPPPTADPWSTMRGCTRILEHLLKCQARPSFKQVEQSWCDPGSPPSLTRHRLRQRLLSWRKGDQRRLSCAIWTGETGAAENVGERSPLARAAASGSACDAFNQQLEHFDWLRARVAETP